MPAVYDTVVRDGHTLDCLEDPEAGLRIEVNRLGAEPVSIARLDNRGTWRKFLYRDGDVSKAASGWNNHATVMGYYVARIKNERAIYRGEPLSGGTHSFLRHKVFAAPKMSDGAITYEMPADGFEAAEYPYKVSMKLTYRLSGDRISVEFAFHNHESCNSAHIGFGLHPGFAVSSIASAQLTLPPGYYVRHLAPDNFLSGEQQAFDFPGGALPYPKEELPGSFLLELAGVPRKVVTLEDREGGRRVELDLSQAPYLTVWSDGGPFICVEPCWGLPDHEEQRPFEDKLGMQELLPDADFSASFTIRPDCI